MVSQRRRKTQGAWLLAALWCGQAGSRAADGPGEPEPPAPITIQLSLEPTILDMDRLRASRMGYMPAKFKLVADRPAAISKEPDYRGTPGYGCFRVGNGPHSLTLFAVDEPDGEEGRLYVDRNQNGDLTDDGPGTWDTTRELDGVNSYMGVVPVRCSWGSPLEEEEGGEYHLFIYKRHGAMNGGYAKISGRAGECAVADRRFAVVLAENTNDGLFTVPAIKEVTRRPVELYVDLDGDGTFQGVVSEQDGKEFRSPERFNLAEPFPIAGQWYLGRPSISGAVLTLVPADPPGSDVLNAQRPVEIKRLLEVGTAAPGFEVESADGKPLGLAAFNDKIVILDFWATWCGPCQSAMPGLERVYQAVRDQGVEVLSLNVYDDREAFRAWVAANGGSKYSFTFAYDPAEKGDPKSVAGGLYHVPGLPTMYVIDRQGKVAAALVGAGQEKPLLEVLAGLGIDVKPPPDAADGQDEP